ncbi:MAG: hypothetical protein AB1831_11560 [Pseudomonadota bacterium]
MKRWILLLPLLPLLAGCLQDAASYSLGERDQAITLMRNKTWFWKDTVDVEVIIARMPDCNGGGSIKEVEQASAMTLYRAPDEYPEPLFLLKTSAGVYAVSAQSCRMQKFPEAPADLGQKLGAFKEVDGKFRFVEAGA